MKAYFDLLDCINYTECPFGHSGHRNAALGSRDHSEIQAGRQKVSIRKVRWQLRGSQTMKKGLEGRGKRRECRCSYVD